MDVDHSRIELLTPSKRPSQPLSSKVPSLAPIPEEDIPLHGLHRNYPSVSASQQLLGRSSVLQNMVADAAAFAAWSDTNVSTLHLNPRSSAVHLKPISHLGGAYCPSCDSRPTHRLVPCQHTICDDHLLVGHHAESSVPTFCARCYQSVTEVIEILGKNQTLPSHDSLFATAHLSPPSSIASTIWSTTSALPDRRLKMNAPEGPRAWGYSEFVPQTPSQSQPVSSNFAVQQFSAPQQSTMHAYGGGEAQSQQAFIHPQYPNAQYSQPAAGHYASVYGHQMNHTHGRSYSVVQSQALADPFLDNRSMMQSPQGFTAPILRSMNQTSGAPIQKPSLPPPAKDVRSEAYKANAARLAAQIKSGFFEDSGDSRPSRGRRVSYTHQPQRERRGTGVEWALQQPVVPLAPVVRQSFVLPEVVPIPAWFQALSQGYRPTPKEAFDSIPFTELFKDSKPSSLGVIKISNIPYGTSKNEIVAAVGRNARLVNQPAGTPYYAIHIIMERSTGKTMDCFVELESEAEAKITVGNYEHRCMNGRAPKIGDRHIDVELSSQEALMKEMFPRAKCVKWTGNVPEVYKTTEPFNSGFNGFLTGEEMVMVQKHAETPQRSPFAQRCHNRTYECLISTLHKYPWFAIEYVTLGERAVMFNATIGCIRALVAAIRKNNNPIAITRQLLQEVICAALSCAGFSHQQKAFVCDTVQYAGFAELLATVPFTYMAALGPVWPFEILIKAPGVTMEVLMFYIGLLREGSATSDENYSVAAYGLDPNASPFGSMRVDYTSNKPMSEMTFKKVATTEWDAVEATIHKALRNRNPALTIGQ